MSATLDATRIELPLWYAGWTFAGAPALPLAGSGRLVQSSRVGALDVHRAADGADIALFGAADAPSAIVFDGYLFDRDEWCRQLQLARDASNARIAAAGYQRWGVDVLARFAGSYLIAIWDAGQRRLILGHDPLGRHPVFYAMRPEACWFASNVLALAGSGKVSNRPNRLSLALNALTFWPQAGETFFEDIKRLRPGHRLEVGSDGRAREIEYWHPIPDSSDEWLSEKDVIDGFEPALLRAVDRCMQLSPEGIMLSGGVDSVTVAALAAEHRRAHGGPPIVAFSGRADVAILAEEHMQTRAADALGMPHLVSRTGEWTGNRNDIDLSLEVAADLPGPSRIYWVGTYMAFYRRAVAHDLHVLLTGSGGDNWLAVADVHAADLIRRFRFDQLTRFIQAAAGTGGSSYAIATRRLLWNGGVRPLIDTLAAQLLPGPKARFHRRRASEFIPGWLCPDPLLREALVESLLARRTPAVDASGRAPRNYYQHSLRSVTNPHLYHEFETAFHVDAMCGLRLLSPYHDRDLVSFFTRIPPAVLVHGNKYKGLLRPVVERHLPGLGFGQQRKDYPKAALDLDLKNMRDGVMAALPAHHFPWLRELGVIDPGGVQAEGQRAGSQTSLLPLVRLFALMSAERWVTARAA